MWNAIAVIKLTRGLVEDSGSISYGSVLGSQISSSVCNGYLIKHVGFNQSVLPVRYAMGSFVSEYSNASQFTSLVSIFLFNTVIF